MLKKEAINKAEEELRQKEKEEKMRIEAGKL